MVRHVYISIYIHMCVYATDLPQHRTDVKRPRKCAPFEWGDRQTPTEVTGKACAGCSTTCAAYFSSVVSSPTFIPTEIRVLNVGNVY